MFRKVFVAPNLTGMLAGMYIISSFNLCEAQPATAVKVQGKQQSAFTSDHVKFSYPSELANKIEIKTNPAVKLASPDDKPDGVAPEHFEVTFKGSNAKLFVIPTSAHKVSATDFKKSYPTTVAAKTDLQKVLASSGKATNIPVLPWADQSCAFEVQQKSVEFKNGKVIRYVGEYLIEPDVIDNQGLVYSAQGLTKDGKWYISLTAPISTKLLPAKGDVSKFSKSQSEKFSKDFGSYSKQIGAKLQKLPDSGFQPNLSTWDKVIKSLLVQ